MNYKHVSDIEILSVEWENESGYRYWESFETAELMNEALRANEAYNAQPEVAAAIKADEQAGDRKMAEYAYNEAVEASRSENGLMTVNMVKRWSILFMFSETMTAEIARLVRQHNKRVQSLRSRGAASFQLGSCFPYKL